MELFEKEIKVLENHQKRVAGFTESIYQIQKLMNDCMDGEFNEYGKWINVEPSEDSIYFNRYCALKEIIEMATKLAMQNPSK